MAFFYFLEGLCTALLHRVWVIHHVLGRAFSDSSGNFFYRPIATAVDRAAFGSIGNKIICGWVIEGAPSGPHKAHEGVMM